MCKNPLTSVIFFQSFSFSFSQNQTLILSKGWYTHDVHYEGSWREVRQKWDVIGRRGWGCSECSGRPIFIFFIKEDWICAMTKHHAESNINILLTRNFPFDSDIRQSHLLMILLHCLWVKLNNRTRGQFECDVTWFCFCFHFVRSHARYCYCSIVCWRAWGRGRRVRLKLDVQSQVSEKISDVDG